MTETVFFGLYPVEPKRSKENSTKNGRMKRVCQVAALRLLAGVANISASDGTRLLKLHKVGHGNTWAPNSLGSLQALQDLNQGGAAALLGIDRLVGSIVELFQSDGQLDAGIREESLRKALRELSQEVGVVGSGRAVAWDQLVIGANTVAGLNGGRDTGFDTEILRDNGGVDTALARDVGRESGGRSGSGEKSDDELSLHFECSEGIKQVL